MKFAYKNNREFFKKIETIMHYISIKIHFHFCRIAIFPINNCRLTWETFWNFLFFLFHLQNWVLRSETQITQMELISEITTPGFVFYGSLYLSFFNTHQCCDNAFCWSIFHQVLTGLYENHAKKIILFLESRSVGEQARVAI
jgi:hypothetical protein